MSFTIQVYCQIIMKSPLMHLLLVIYYKYILWLLPPPPIRNLLIPESLLCLPNDDYFIPAGEVE